MEKILWCGLVVVTIVAGVIMVVCPAWAVSNSLDADERRPPTLREIWFMRVFGAAVLLGGVYGLYALLTGMPGAEGPPLP